MKLRSHLVLFGVATVVPVLLVVAVFVWWTASLQHEGTERTVRTATRALSLAVDRELGRAEAVLLTLAASPDIDAGDLASLHRQAAAVSAAGAWIAMITPAGAQVFNTLRPFGERLPRATNMDAIWAVVGARRTFVSDLFVGAIAQRPIVSVDVPVVRGGAVRYSIDMAFGPERLAELLGQEQLAQGWSAAIVDRTGAVIARTGETAHASGARAPDAWLSGVPTGEGGLAPSSAADGSPVYRAWMTSDMSGWRVIVAVPRAVVVAPVRRMLGIVGGAGAVFVIAVAAAALVFGQRIAGAIAGLVRSADALGQGHEILPSTSRVREVDTVHRALQSASQGLRERAAVRERLLAEQAAREAAEHSAAALQASEARFSLALSVARMGTWDLDLAAERAICSEAVFRIFGYTPPPEGAAPVDWWTSRIHPADAERVARAFREARRQRSLFSPSHRIVRVDNGDTVWLDVASRFFYDEDGRAVRMLGVLWDVSEQKKAEAAARESAALFAAVSEATSDAIFVKDRQGRVLLANPAMLRVLGKEADAVVGKTAVEFIGAERGRPMMQNDQRVMEADRAELFEESPVPGVTFLANKAPYRDAHGNVVGVIGIARDVTEQKRIEAEHEALRHELEAVTGNATLALFMADESRRCTYMNPAAEQMTGFTLAELRERRFHEAIHHTRPDGRPYAASECPIAQTVLRGEPYRGEDFFIHRDGHFFPVAYAASPLRREGRVVGVVLEVRDVTAEKAAEAERADLLVREQRAREEAEAANRAKDEFLATLSHELRTPLNAMLGWIRLLRSGSLDDATSRRALQVIERNVEAQTQLITDLLDVSRIVSGKLALELHPLDLARVVGASLDAVRPAAEAKDLKTDVDLAEGCRVLGDATRLQQVVWNLLSNAVKFTPVGGRIGIRLARTGRAVQLVVSDTGKGIEPEFLPLIFDRFRQADSSSTRAHAGLGLGLAIVRHLVELHGGTVAAQSGGPGSGTEMTVELPAEQSVAVDEPQGPAPERWGDDRPARSLDGVKVLVVDDNADTCDLLATIFTGEGAVTSAALSAREALERFDRFRPDVLVSDIAMPGMSGYDLVRRLRQRARAEGGAVPAVALTAYARLADRDRALAAGFQAYLCKPANPAELVTTVLQLLGRQRDVPRPRAATTS